MTFLAERSGEEEEGAAVSVESRLLKEDLPTPTGEMTLPPPNSMNHWKMWQARNSHIFGGYAAVQDVSYSPFELWPVNFLKCLCPQSRGSGP